MEQQQQKRQAPRGSRRLQYAAAFSATLGYVTFGAFLGWGAPVLPRLTSNTSHIPTTEDEASWIIASSSLSMVFPMLFIGHLVDIVGRKRMLLFTVFPHSALWLIQIFATQPWELMLSRVIGAIAQCIVLVASPCYLVEIAELEIRGTLITIYQVMQNLGTLVVFCVAPYVHFRTLAGILLAFPLLLVATLSWMPESPTYLLLRGRNKEAQQSLVRLRGMNNFEDVEEEFAAMRRAVEERNSDPLARGGYAATMRELVCDPVNRRTLLLASALQALLLWCGFLVMMTYATFFFKLSGSSLDPDLSSISLAVIQLIMSVVASVAVERFRTRKIPLMVCFSGACLALISEGFYFYMKDGLHADVSSIGWLPLTAHIAFLIFNTLGPGALIWTVCGEVFRPRVKGVAMSVLSIVNCGSAFATLKTYHLMYTYFDLYYSFWMFATICLGGMVFVWQLVPETKGRHPEEVALEIAGLKPGRTADVPATAEEMQKIKV
ncbi:facilitated trehalose transporter Tret1-like [Schistocerca serialis cubense]|uniref:facilitated trehalose transporter Tret1-like n=1 Tax=Schistocerca serialis cubense TaxID=2023355 RepID=UPI00214E8FC1|nr:facilitated trehalose transporter Tret1-like [Schistocerca serialis cubense]